MRKPSFKLFEEFKRIFDKINTEENLRQQIIPYFISSHPGCREEDMAELAVITKRLDFHLEQVQDFTPTPMTVSTETWYSGYDPYTLEPVFSAKTPREKLAQRQFFFWYKPEERRGIEQELRRIGRPDLIQQLYAGVPAPNQGRNFGNNRRPEFERQQFERDIQPRDKNRRGHDKQSDKYEGYGKQGAQRDGYGKHGTQRDGYGKQRDYSGGKYGGGKGYNAAGGNYGGSNYGNGSYGSKTNGNGHGAKANRKDNGRNTRRK